MFCFLEAYTFFFRLFLLVRRQSQYLKKNDILILFANINSSSFLISPCSDQNLKNNIEHIQEWSFYFLTDLKEEVSNRRKDNLEQDLTFALYWWCLLLAWNTEQIPQFLCTPISSPTRQGMNTYQHYRTNWDIICKVPGTHNTQDILIPSEYIIYLLRKSIFLFLNF